MRSDRVDRHWLELAIAEPRRVILHALFSRHLIRVPLPWHDLGRVLRCVWLRLCTRGFPMGANVMVH